MWTPVEHLMLLLIAGRLNYAPATTISCAAITRHQLVYRAAATA